MPMADICCVPANDQIVPDQDDMFAATGSVSSDADSASPTGVGLLAKVRSCFTSTPKKFLISLVVCLQCALLSFGLCQYSQFSNTASIPRHLDPLLILFIIVHVIMQPFVITE